MESHETAANSNAKRKKLIFGLFVIALYVFDVVSDIAVMISYLTNGHIIYFGLTLVFVLIPAKITNLYVTSVLQQYALFSGFKTDRLKLIFGFFNLGYLWILIEAQIYDWRNRQRDTTEESERNTRKKYKEIINKMRVWEALLEATPQLYLQLYIFLRSTVLIRSDFDHLYLYPDISYIRQNNGTSFELWKEQYVTAAEATFQVCSIFGSFAMITLSVTYFMRKYTKDKLNAQISMQGFILYVLWQLCWIVTNVFSLSLFASVFTFWVIVPTVIRITVQRLFEYLVLQSNPCELSASFFDTSFLTVKFCDIKRKFSFTLVVISFAYCALDSSCLVALWCSVVDKSIWIYWFCVIIHVSVLVLQFIFMWICLYLYNRSVHNYCQRLFISRNKLDGEDEKGFVNANFRKDSEQ